MAHPEPALCRPPSLGKCFSCEPQPSSAGCAPSLTKPSTDQVFTNSLSAFGTLETWVSRSAMCITLTLKRCASLAQSARVVGGSTLTPVSSAILTKACLTRCETKPGLDP